jgi:hypothetical protein
MVSRGSDGIYHFSFSDITIDVANHQITITGVKLSSDTVRINSLRRQKQHVPKTISDLTASQIVLSGVNWSHLLLHKTLDCDLAVANDALWHMETNTVYPDPGTKDGDESSPIVTRFFTRRFEVVNPNVTYHYTGKKSEYRCQLSGGKAILNNWAFNSDITRDTSVFLYAQNGSVDPKLFVLERDGKHYAVNTPHIDFESTPNSVTLKNVAIDKLVDVSRKTGQQLESYTFRSPSIEFDHFNWNTLLLTSTLSVPEIHLSAPSLEVDYKRHNFPQDNDKMGKFPNQLIHDFIKTHIGTLHIKNGRIQYNEPQQNGTDAIFVFGDISGTFNNITNIDSFVKTDSSCVIKLEGKFMNKSQIKATFNLSLADTTGRFSVDGYVDNLDGKDVSKQAAAFTFVKVTSFHLSRMICHVEGDQSYGKGNYTMFYNDLKISLFKFDSTERKRLKGPLVYLADALVLYPNNPMGDKPPRSTDSYLKRDPNKGFISLVWQNIYLGAQKTAVRNQKILALSGNKQDDQQPEQQKKKKNFFQRLFGKKNK